MTPFHISIIIEISNEEKRGGHSPHNEIQVARAGTAHPAGMVVGEIQNELGISASTLSHHLDKLKHEDLIRVSREGTFLRYTASTEVLQELLTFLYAECCTRNKAIKPEKIVRICK